ncbi:unnamed protein product, partial [Choristocarpus tenellus]
NHAICKKGEGFEFPANATSFSSTECETAFEGLSNIEDVACTRGSVDINGGATYTLELLSFPTYPHQNNIFHHDGWPTLDAFSCDASNVTGADGAACELTVLQDDDLQAYSFCFPLGLFTFHTWAFPCLFG